MSEPSLSLDLAVIAPALEKYGGAERLIVECVARWQTRHRVTLYATAISDQLLLEHGIDARVRRVRLSPYFEGEHSLLLNATLLPRIWHDEIGPHDLYHTHLWPAHLVDHHPMVWYPHEPFRTRHDLRYELKTGGEAENTAHIYPKYDYDRFADRLYEPYLRAIDAADASGRPERIVANSHYTARYLSRVYDREVTDIVYPGAEPARAIDLPRDPHLFVTIGQLWSHKRVRLLIEAVARTDEAQLVVIGSGPETHELNAMSDRLGVSDRVFFFSGLKNSELELILGRACAFLFAPIREPFGIVVLEAMAAGLPVIAVSEGGYTEICTPETAFLVPPLPGAFAEKMTLLQQDANLRSSMGRAARAAAATLTWTRTANELEAVLLATARANPVTPSPPAALERTLVGAQYYLWYGEGYGASHWNDNPATGYVSDIPIGGYYGSSKGETINRHLDLFEEIGLDYVILNLHIDETGLNPIEWLGIRHVFRLAEERGSGLRFAIQLAPYSRDMELLRDTIERIERSYARSPNYLRLEGAPVLFWFWSSAFDRRIADIDQLRSCSQGFANIAAGLRLPAADDEEKLSGSLFDGFAPYSPLELADASTRERVWTMGYEAAARAGMRWRVATVSPGYDDAALTDPRRDGNPRRVVPREAGATYRAGFAWVEQLDPPPDLVMISTFNELHENTHIEPTTHHGDLYLELTRDFVARLRDRSGSPP